MADDVTNLTDARLARSAQAAPSYARQPVYVSRNPVDYPELRHLDAEALKAILTQDNPLGLRFTATMGEFLNSSGVLVNSVGISFNFLSKKKSDDDYWAEQLGKRVESPAELLRAVALDPRQPLETRMRAAEKAAPYYDTKTPTVMAGALDVGGAASTPEAAKVFDLGALVNMAPEDRKALIELLKKAGATL